jgi:hypothetical protein
MASNIISDTIDAAYPVAGVDNDTQGFRDNFQIIKDNFTAAKNEIEALQNGTAKLATTNNFNGTTLTGANLVYSTQTHFETTVANSSGVEVNLTFGHFFTIKLNLQDLQNATVPLTLTGFPNVDGNPAIKFTVILKALEADNGQGIDPVPVNFVTSSNLTLLKSANWPSTLAVDSPQFNSPIIIEFTKIGSTVYGEYKGMFSA